MGPRRFETRRDTPLECRRVPVVQHDGHRVLAKVPAVERQLRQAGSEFFDEGGGTVIDQELARRGWRVAEIARETHPRVVKMATLGVNLPSNGSLPFALP